MMTFIEVAAFMLIKDGHVLVEKRKLSKKYDPGKIAIPGGRIKQGETSEETMHRELKEELGVQAQTYSYLCTLLQHADEMPIKIHYYTIFSWTGTLQNNEAKKYSGYL